MRVMKTFQTCQLWKPMKSEIVWNRVFQAFEGFPQAFFGSLEKLEKVWKVFFV